MNRKYSKKEMKQILKRDIEISPLTEEKIQDAYDCIRRGAVVQEVRKKKTGGFGRYMAVAAVVGLLGISSVTVLAMNGFFEKTVQKEGGSLDYEFTVDFELVHKVVEMEPGYIPEGYEEVEVNKYDKEGYRQNGLSFSIVNAAMLEVMGDRLDCDNVKSLEETTLQGMEAHLLTIDYDPKRVTRLFDKRIYLFNEQDGFVGVIYGGNDISMDELKKVAENINFVVTDTVVEPVSQEDADEPGEREALDRFDAIYEFGVPAEHIHSIGESLKDFESSKEIQVKNVEILDSIEGLDTSYFFDFERVSKGVDADGKVTSYQRITQRLLEDGTVEEKTEEVGRKLLKVTLEATNLEEETAELWAGGANLQYLYEKEDGNYAYADKNEHIEPLNRQEDDMVGDWGEPVWFDQSPYADQMTGHFFFCDLNAGETLEYQLIYVVDEDRLENLYLRFFGEYADVIQPDTGEFLHEYVALDLQ